MSIFNEKKKGYENKDALDSTTSPMFMNLTKREQKIMDGGAKKKNSIKVNKKNNTNEMARNRNYDIDASDDLDEYARKKTKKSNNVKRQSTKQKNNTNKMARNKNYDLDEYTRKKVKKESKKSINKSINKSKKTSKKSINKSRKTSKKSINKSKRAKAKKSTKGSNKLERENSGLEYYKKFQTKAGQLLNIKFGNLLMKIASHINKINKKEGIDAKELFNLNISTLEQLINNGEIKKIIADIEKLIAKK
jgi:hypothetical protein